MSLMSLMSLTAIGIEWLPDGVTAPRRAPSLISVGSGSFA